MKKQQIIKNVNSILQDTTGIFISNSEGLCDINNKIIQKGDYFNTSNNYIYGYDKEITIIKIENVLKKISTGYTSGCKIFSNNDIICYKLILKENSVEYLLINDDDTTTFRVTGRNIPIYKENDKIVFTDKKQQIFLYNITNGSILWSYTLPEGFKIFGQVQVIDNLLILYAVDNNFDHSKTIALDINSGNMKWVLDNTIFCQVDTEKKLLLGYAIRRYEVIDPFLGKKIVQKSMMDYYEKGLSPVSPNNTIANGKLWFVSGRGENAKFGRINIETSEVDFIQDFPLQNDWQFSKPVFHNGKLYLLDSNNTLHIFEE